MADIAQTQVIVSFSDNAPEVYGSRPEVRALAQRIMAIHPAARQLGDRGALLLAQLGIALGLNPLPGTGHIHAWVDDGQICVHIGLEGRAALARHESPFSVSTRPMRAEEIAEHDLKPGDRGAIAELYRHDLTREQTALGLPVHPVIGIGIAKSNERIPKGRSLAWRASQRATKDALRAAYSFALPGELASAMRLTEEESDVPQNVVEGAAADFEHELPTAEVAETSEPTLSVGPAHTDNADNARPYAPETLKAILTQRAEANGDGEVSMQRRGLFAGKLEELFAPDTDSEAKRKTVMRYLWDVESVKSMAAGQVLAGFEWLKLRQDESGYYHPDVMAVREARAILEVAVGEATHGQ